MTLATARSAADRKADTLSRFRAANGDTWVATGSAAGAAYLVPLSYAWDGQHVVIAAQADSATARNLRASGRARLGFGPTRDVVLVDAAVARELPVHDPAADAPGRIYAEQADWDPREEPEGYVFFLLRPRRVQAWREANELAGRVLMRDGEWLV